MTPDQLPDGEGWAVERIDISTHNGTLAMDARVNGERGGGGNSGQMHHKWPAVLAHISASETVYAGEVIGRAPWAPAAD